MTTTTLTRSDAHAAPQAPHAQHTQEGDVTALLVCPQCGCDRAAEQCQPLDEPRGGVGAAVGVGFLPDWTVWERQQARMECDQCQIPHPLAGMACSRPRGHHGDHASGDGNQLEGQWRNTESRTVWVVVDLAPSEYPWCAFQQLRVGDVTDGCWSDAQLKRALLNMDGQQVRYGYLQVPAEATEDVVARWLMRDGAALVRQVAVHQPAVTEGE